MNFDFPHSETVILHKLRGHDAEIASLEWMKFSPSKYTAKAPLKSDNNTPAKLTGKTVKKSIATPSKLAVDTPPKSVGDRLANPTANTPSRVAACLNPEALTPARSMATSTPGVDVRRKQPLMGRRARDACRAPAKPIVDADDMFDMYSFDYQKVEFGTTVSKAPEPSNTKSDQLDDSEIEAKQKSVCASNDKFDFVEACQSLRSQIVESKAEEVEEADANNAVNMSDIREMKALSPDMGDVSLDALSLRSTIGSSHNQSELADLEQVLEEMQISDSPDDEVFLASGSLESYVVIWNTKEGRLVDKIQFKTTHHRPPIPSEFDSSLGSLFSRIVSILKIQWCAPLFRCFSIQNRTAQLHGSVQMK